MLVRIPHWLVTPPHWDSPQKVVMTISISITQNFAEFSPQKIINAHIMASKIPRNAIDKLYISLTDLILIDYIFCSAA